VHLLSLSLAEIAGNDDNESMIQSLLRSQRKLIVGHRGVAGEMTENTMASYWLAIRQGADMVELDVQLTRDRQLIAFHDWDLERLGADRSVVEESLLSSLQEIGVGESGPEGSRRIRISSLREVMDELPASQALNVELKRRTADPVEMATEFARLIQGRGQILVSSFDWDLLAEVRSVYPDCMLAPIGRKGQVALLEAAERLEACSIHCSRRVVDKGLIEGAALQGRPLLVYTVNEAQEARELFKQGVRGVFSDFPGRLRRRLEE
jgi:glycerophosphoryl diester phosphodiesterase